MYYLINVTCLPALFGSCNISAHLDSLHFFLKYNFFLFIFICLCVCVCLELYCISDAAARQKNWNVSVLWIWGFIWLPFALFIVETHFAVTLKTQYRSALLVCKRVLCSLNLQTWWPQWLIPMKAQACKQ